MYATKKEFSFGLNKREVAIPLIILNEFVYKLKRRYFGGKFFKYNGKVVDIENYDPTISGIFSREVLRMIHDGEKGWENLLPEGIAEMIKSREQFGYDSVMH